MEPYLIKSLAMRHGTKLGLRPNQKECLWHLLDHDFDGKGYAWPSIATIGERMGIESGNGVRKIIKSLQRLNLIEVKRTEGLTNKYHFRKLIAVLAPFLKEEAEKMQKLTPQQKLTQPPNKSSGEGLTEVDGYPLTKVNPNSLNYNSKKELYEDNSPISEEPPNGAQVKKKNGDLSISQIAEVMAYLNLRTGKNYRHTTRKNSALIAARLKEGFTVDECKIVIDKKTEEWLNDPKMDKFLRPETLFGSKFDGYLNQKSGLKEKGLFEKTIERMVGNGTLDINQAMMEINNARK